MAQKRHIDSRETLVLPRVPSECPQEVADLYHDCVRPNPADRPTAEKVVARLEDCIGLGQVWPLHMSCYVHILLPIRCFAHLLHMSFPGYLTALLCMAGPYSETALDTRSVGNGHLFMFQALGRSESPAFAVNTPSATKEASCAVQTLGPSALRLTAAVTVLSLHGFIVCEM